jgi:ClpP class serine protease
MRFQRVIEQVLYRPWFITAEGHAAVRKVLQAAIVRANGDTPDLSMFLNPREEMEILPSGIAKIHVCGVLGKGLSPIEKSCGNTDYEEIADEIEDAIEAGARGIFLDISSPGGTVVGNAEIAETIAAVEIPTLAYSEDLACSAAYNIAVSCDYAFGSPSSTWGSIGTIIPWIDQSAMWSMEGLEWAPITNAEGDLKAAMHGPSLTPDQRASLEQYVQDAFDQFRGNVLRTRLVSADAMRGQAFFAPRALSENLIDRITSEDEAMAFLESQLS